jgi:hypothetical protein
MLIILFSNKTVLFVDVFVVFCYRIDKICIQTSSVIKIVATDHWIIKICPYTMNVAHQSDVALCLLSSDTHAVSPNNPGGAQFLNIEVKSVRRGVAPFQIRYNNN